MQPPAHQWRNAVALLLLGVTGCAAPPPPVVVATPQPVETPPQLDKRPIPASGKHVVAAGETLSEIAWMYGLGTRALAQANNLSDPDDLLWGKPLYLRGSFPTEVAQIPLRRDGLGLGAEDGNGLGRVAEPAPLRVVFVATPTTTEVMGDNGNPLRIVFSEQATEQPPDVPSEPFGP